jgi:hypothetical protein
MKYLCAVLVAAACAALVFSGCSKKAGVMEIKTPVSKNIKGITGELEFTKEICKGVTLVSVFTGPCNICADEQKEVNAFADKMAGKAKTISVNAARPENGDVINKYKFGPPYPILVVFVDGAEVERAPNNFTPSDLIEKLVAAHMEKKSEPPADKPKDIPPPEPPKENTPPENTPPDSPKPE